MLLTLSLETLVASLIEVFLHNGFFKVFWIMHLEGTVSLPGNNVIESQSIGFFQNSVKLPWEGCLPIASNFRQESRHHRSHSVYVMCNSGWLRVWSAGVIFVTVELFLPCFPCRVVFRSEDRGRNDE